MQSKYTHRRKIYRKKRAEKFPSSRFVHLFHIFASLTSRYLTCLHTAHKQNLFKLVMIWVELKNLNAISSYFFSLSALSLSAQFCCCRLSLLCVCIACVASSKSTLLFFGWSAILFCSACIYVFFFSSPIFVDAVLLTAAVRASVCIVDWMATLARKKNKFSANPSHIWYLSCLECIIWQCCVLCWCIELATLPRAVYLNSSVLWFAQGDRRFARLLAVAVNNIRGQKYEQWPSRHTIRESHKN